MEIPRPDHNQISQSHQPDSYQVEAQIVSRVNSEDRDVFPNIEVKPKSTPWRFLMLILLIGVIVIGSFYAISHPPSDFVPGTIVRIREGASLKDAGDILYDKKIIRSSSLFQFIVNMGMPNKQIIAGDFAFEVPVTVFKVAQMTTGGGFGGTQVRITIPEGSSVADIATIVAKALPGWNTDEFVAKAKKDEGYLFPDTYLVFKSITPTELIDRLKKEYGQKIAPYRDAIKKSGKTESQIIIMASLLEKEAKTREEAEIISGILWKRIAHDRALQVDAPFLYILGKGSAQLTRADLAKDGPYNTYTRKGLPAGPIGNPGVSMIDAALNPKSSPYWYYLHGDDGKIRYAKTYEEHLVNKKKYIK